MYGQSNLESKDPTFKDQVNQEKARSRKENIKNTKLDPQQVDAYFAEHGYHDLTYEKIKILLQKVTKADSARLPDLKEDLRDEIVEQHIISSFKELPATERTPQKLVEIIASYIKSHMQYDAMTITIDTKMSSLFSFDNEIDDVIASLEDQGYCLPPERIQKLRSGKINVEQFILDTYIDQKYVNISDHQMQSMIPLLEKYMLPFQNRTSKEKHVEIKKPQSKFVKDPKSFQGDSSENIHLQNEVYIRMNELYNIICAGDKKGFINKVKHANFLVLLLLSKELDGTGINKELTLLGQYSLYQMLHEIKIGVCRHYSLIAKQLYQKCAPHLGLPESDLLFVCNDKHQHAYNVLLTPNSWWGIEKRYLDITSYISGKELWLSDERRKKLGEKNELYVEQNNVTQDTKESG